MAKYSGAQALLKLVGHEGPVVTVCFYTVGSNVMLATGSRDKNVLLWDCTDGKCCGKLEGHTDTVTCVLFLQQRGVLASGSLDAHIKLWDVTSSKCKCLTSIVPEANWDLDPIKGLALNPQGTVLASACQEFDKVNLHLWDLATLTRVDSVSPGRVSVETERIVLPLAPAPDGETISVSEYEHILLARKGVKAPRFTGHTKDVTSLAFSPDGSVLLSGSADCSVRTWDAAHVKPLATLGSHGDEVTSVAMHPSGAYAASGSCDGTAKLWDVQGGHCLATLSGHSGPVLSVSFSPDGRLLASASEDGTARVWVLTSSRSMDF